MSFYLRKSIKAGPFRVNLSGSGIGVSTGIPGLRVGAGPRGTYVRMGRGGVRYQQTRPRSTPSRAAASRGPAQGGQSVNGSDVALADMTGATTLQLLDASPSDLVSQVNAAAGTVSLMPLAIFLYLLIVTIPLGILVQARNKARKTVVAFYEVDDVPAENFQRLTDAFGLMQQCAASWQIVAAGMVRTTQQYKTNAGASSIQNRVRGTATIKGPRMLATNIAVPSLHARKRSVYFLPDRILVRDQKTYAEIPYSACRVTGSRTRFIQGAPLPGDGTKVGTTWKYVNKGGGPDRRYKNNPQLAIMLYGELMLQTANGFYFEWQTSRPDAVSATAAALSAMS
jgi:hypothetical protein